MICEWWITTDYFERGGRKIAGPYRTLFLAMEERSLRERSKRYASLYYIDSLPAREVIQ